MTKMRDQCETLSKERDALLGTLNDVRSRFAWDLPAFQPAADDFVFTSQRFFDDLSGRFSAWLDTRLAASPA